MRCHRNELFAHNALQNTSQAGKTDVNLNTDIRFYKSANALAINNPFFSFESAVQNSSENAVMWWEMEMFLIKISTLQELNLGNSKLTFKN